MSVNLDIIETRKVKVSVGSVIIMRIRQVVHENTLKQPIIVVQVTQDALESGLASLFIKCSMVSVRNSTV